MESAQAGSVGMPVAARQLVVHVAHMERLRRREKVCAGCRLPPVLQNCLCPDPKP